jgi:RNA polymerase subunit RPABC4/transcription elongation factor Spt4
LCPKYEEEEAACPVCGKLVSLDVSACPHCGAEFEEEEEAAVEEVADEGAACPVCAKIVSLEVSACPHCGAEFEEEEEEIAAEVSDEESAACPVCGKMASLEVSCCPHCGAEFEEEEVEEIIEVEERRVPDRAPARAKAKSRAAAEAGGFADFFAPTSIVDFRVIGVALIILGVIGSQIALLIDWYWSWVPPIGDNIALFALLPMVILIVGLLVFMLVKKAVTAGKKLPEGIPSFTLSLFLFGIFALVVMLLWSPINSALQSSQVGVAGGFFLVLVIGILLMIMGSRMASEKGSAA